MWNIIKVNGVKLTFAAFLFWVHTKCKSQSAILLLFYNSFVMLAASVVFLLYIPSCVKLICYQKVLYHQLSRHLVPFFSIMFWPCFHWLKWLLNNTKSAKKSTFCFARSKMMKNMTTVSVNISCGEHVPIFVIFSMLNN